jgi:hypothetical protein
MPKADKAAPRDPSYAFRELPVWKFAVTRTRTASCEPGVMLLLCALG